MMRNRPHILVAAAVGCLWMAAGGTGKRAEEEDRLPSDCSSEHI